MYQPSELTARSGVTRIVGAVSSMLRPVTVATAEAAGTQPDATEPDVAQPDVVATPAPAEVKVAKLDPPKVTITAPKKTSKASASAATATVKGQGANVHAEGSSSSRTLFALPGGSKVTVGSNSHGWIQVTDAKGRTGWMYKDYVSL